MEWSLQQREKLAEMRGTGMPGEQEDPPAYISSIDQAIRQDPDEVTEAIRLGQETGLPIGVVRNNPEEAKRRAWLNNLSLNTLPEEAPRTTEWLENPRNAAQASDDIPTIVKIEQLLKKRKEEDDLTAIDLGKILDSWLVGLGKMPAQLMLGLATDPNSPVARVNRKIREDMEEQGNVAGLAQLDESERTQQEFIQRQKDFLLEAEKLQGKLAPRGFWAESAAGGGTMLLDMLPGLAISAATRGRVNPTLPYLTGKTFLESSGSALLEDKPWEEAMRYGALDAVIEYATERFPQKMVEKIVGDLGGKGVKSAVTKWLAMEAGTEQFATLGQTMSALLYDMDEELANAKGVKEVLEIQLRRQAVTFMSTLIGGGSLSATLGAVSHVANRDRRRMHKAMERAINRTQSEIAQEGLEEILFYAQASKTNERAAEVFEDLMETIGPDQKIYMDASIVEDLEDAPEYLVAQLDGSGAPVEMTMGQFITEFANDEAKLALVRNHIKTRENLKSQSELEEDTDSEYIQSLLDKAATSLATKTEIDTIFEQVKNQLVSTRRQGEATASQSAVLIPAMIGAQYEELKARGVKNEDGSEISVKQLFEDMNLKIVGPDAEVGEAAAFISQDEVPESQKALVKGLALLPTADRATVLAAAFQSPDGNISDNASLMDWFARKAGYKNAKEYNAAIKKEGEAYDAFLEDPAQLMAFASTDGAYKQIAFAISNRRGLKMLRDKKERKKIEDALSDATEAELIEIIADEFAPEGKVLPFETPGVLKQQDFGDITLVENAFDEAGNSLTTEISAQVLWDDQMGRTKMIDQLRDCMNG